VKIAPELRRSSPPKPFLSEFHFIRELAHYDFVDCLTYSVSPEIPHLRRVIYVVGRPPRRCETIQVSGTHAKLWIGHTDGKKQAYVGSANATAMTLFELVYKATPEQTRDLVDYFEDLWKLNAPKK
jgi:hypothetical protein